ncbi:hypothetical protein ElyMa_002794600 [Elysia marginata]|uniref:Galectin n=1 Tax=Elysia marginata TaxID=1093978 RepID=A0AAV4HNQ7_9GAST|nr:hypothetical protein ElyMa_002794600 [Elysia marginata]
MSTTRQRLIIPSFIMNTLIVFGSFLCMAFAAHEDQLVFFKVDFATEINHRLLERRIDVHLKNDKWENKTITFRVSCPEDAYLYLKIDRRDGKLKMPATIRVHQNASYDTEGPLEENSLIGHRYKDNLDIVVNLGAKGYVIAYITCKDLIQRSGRLFNDEFYFNISHSIRALTVNYAIMDPQHFKFVRASPLSTEQLSATGKAEVDLSNEVKIILFERATAAYCVYTGNVSFPTGISARFSVQYDMIHHRGGEIYNAWYFVHTIAPGLLYQGTNVTENDTIVFEYGSQVDKKSLSNTEFENVPTGTEMVICGQVSLLSSRHPFSYQIKAHGGNETLNSTILFSTNDAIQYNRRKMFPVADQVCRILKAKQNKIK